MSVLDIVLDIFNIVKVVQQCNKMCKALEDDIKPNYIQYFNGIREASIQYNKALNPDPSVGRAI
jgi:hypothetical protein